MNIFKSLGYKRDLVVVICFLLLGLGSLPIIGSISIAASGHAFTWVSGISIIGIIHAIFGKTLFVNPVSTLVSILAILIKISTVYPPLEPYQGLMEELLKLLSAAGTSLILFPLVNNRIKLQELRRKY